MIVSRIRFTQYIAVDSDNVAYTIYVKHRSLNIMEHMDPCGFVQNTNLDQNDNHVRVMFYIITGF